MNAWVNQRIFGLSSCGDQANDESIDWVADKYILRKTRSRVLFILCIFIFSYMMVIGRMTYLSVDILPNSVAEEETKSAENKDKSTLPVTFNAKRSDIVDRKGMLLATSLRTASLYADPTRIFDSADAAHKLNSIFPELSYDELYKKFDSKKRFVWIKRNITPKQLYLANSLGIPGIDFLNETKRVYPQGAMTAHVLGYTDIDHKGLSGLERGMDSLLEKNNTPLETSLDIRLQHILQREIKKSMEEFKAIGGAGLIMDVNSGEIHALASLPDYNPHNPGSITDMQRFNRITLGAYEMGSTFKTFTTAALLEYTDASLQTTFDARYPLQRAGFRISDFHPEARMLSVPEVFIHSSNVGTALMAEKIGTEQLKNFFGDLGLLQKPSLEIKELAQPILPQTWRPINTITASYGHGIAVTPLQLATATAEIVNGGYKVTPTLIKRASDTLERKRILSEETSAKMRSLLRLVVTDGTATKANAKGYRVGGKTGTAEKTLGRGYSQNAQIASFVGVFPMDNPKFVVLIMVDEPKGNKKSYGYATAGWVAAPYVGSVIKEMAPLVNIRPEHDTRLIAVKEAMGLLPESSVQIPNLQNTTLQKQQGGRLASY